MRVCPFFVIREEDYSSPELQGRFLHAHVDGRWRGQPRVVVIKECNGSRDDGRAFSASAVQKASFHRALTIDTKGPPALGRTGIPLGDTRTGSGVNSPSRTPCHRHQPPTTPTPPPRHHLPPPPSLKSPSHGNEMRGQQAQTHSPYPPDDYTSLKSNNLDSLCFVWCHSSFIYTSL